jgi:NADPH2:quinone reductase
MKAILVTEHGPPEVLRYTDVSDPEPRPEEVLIEIAAAGVNFIDLYHRSGLYAVELPFVPGTEGAGRVVALGPNVTSLREGDRVAYAMQRGSYAELAAVPAGKVVPVPDEIELRLAAAVILQGMTAHYLSHSTYPLSQDHTALIHAAAGGVGSLLVQMAKRRGARVIGTCSTEAKAELARSNGADEMILYTEVDFEQETLRLTDGRGVDVVYDSVGRDTFQKSLNCLRPRGYLVLFGQSGGAVEPVDPLLLRARGSLFLTRPSLSHYIAEREELLSRANDLFEWIVASELKVRVDRTFPLAEAAEAHRYMEGRKSKGKVLLIP